MIKNNETVTVVCNSKRGFTKREQTFIQKATRINEKEHKPFSVLDFPELSKGNFRQIILKLHDVVELVYKSRPCFYKIKGIELVGDSHKITHRVMGGESLCMLQNLREQPAMIHDVKLKCESNIHSILKKNDASIHPNNHSIKLNFPSTDNNIIAKLLVYPKTVQVEIGCTFNPFVYDISGVLHLTSFLGEIRNYVHFLTNFEVILPPVAEWMITHYHFGKDGSEGYDGQMFHRTVDDFSCGLVRYYSKIMPNGDKILRIEQIQTPNNSLNEEIDKIIAQESQKLTLENIHG